LQGSGHKASLAPEDEAAKFMTMLPWVLPIVCITILVLVGVGVSHSRPALIMYIGLATSFPVMQFPIQML
jgi:hypothetical protein